MVDVWLGLMYWYNPIHETCTYLCVLVFSIRFNFCNYVFSKCWENRVERRTDKKMFCCVAPHIESNRWTIIANANATVYMDQMQAAKTFILSHCYEHLMRCMCVLFTLCTCAQTTSNIVITFSVVFLGQHRIDKTSNKGFLIQ